MKTIIIEGDEKNISFVISRLKEIFTIENVTENHLKISDLDAEIFQERAMETLKAIISKVENEIQEEEK